MLRNIAFKAPRLPMWDRQSQRLLLAYKGASLAIVAISLCWLCVFISKQWMALAYFELVLATVGLVSFLLIRTGLLFTALIFSELAFLILTVVFCLMFDVPSEAVPRVSHLFLLVLAMLGYINYLRSRSYFQLVLLVACLGFFIVFSSARLALPFAQPIPDEFRLYGAWINAFVATAMLCACISIIQLEFSRRRRMVRELQAALQNDEFELHYQPLVDEVGRICGAEALLRWTHPARGLVAPGLFIPVAEENGLMPQLGGWVLRDACRTLACWSRDDALGKLVLSVNVSAEQFVVDGFEEFVLDTLRLCGADASRLKLELTESVLVSATGRLAPKMNVLRAAGVTFALDDFGTGYSSLGYLRNLPIEQLKIDRSFVQEGLDSERGTALIRSIVQIGRNLNLFVLAEGVETKQQHELLLDCGCTAFQGYLFGRPVPRVDFENHVRASRTKADIVALVQPKHVPTERVRARPRSATGPA